MIFVIKIYLNWNTEFKGLLPESDSLDKWKQDELESEWWEMKSMETESNSSGSKAEDVSNMVDALWWYEYVWLWLVFIDDVTAGRITKMNSEV